MIPRVEPSPCDGCGAAGAAPVESFAAVEADRELEVVLLRCGDCGEETEVVLQVA